jgi:hypothetical protein
MSETAPVIFWHRDLPPAAAEAIAEHTLEAQSTRVRSTFTHRDELWDVCHADLMQQTHERLKQEIGRLGGRYAHVLTEQVDIRHDDRTGEAWLHGCFTYMLYA